MNCKIKKEKIFLIGFVPISIFLFQVFAITAIELIDYYKNAIIYLAAYYAMFIGGFFIKKIQQISKINQNPISELNLLVIQYIIVILSIFLLIGDAIVNEKEIFSFALVIIRETYFDNSITIFGRLSGWLSMLSTVLFIYVSINYRLSIYLALFPFLVTITNTLINGGRGYLVMNTMAIICFLFISNKRKISSLILLALVIAVVGIQSTRGADVQDSATIVLQYIFLPLVGFQELINIEYRIDYSSQIKLLSIFFEAEENLSSLVFTMPNGLSVTNVFGAAGESYAIFGKYGMMIYSAFYGYLVKTLFSWFDGTIPSCISLYVASVLVFMNFFTDPLLSNGFISILVIYLILCLLHRSVSWR